VRRVLRRGLSGTAVVDRGMEDLLGAELYQLKLYVFYPHKSILITIILVNHSDPGRAYGLPHLAATISHARPIFFMKNTQVLRQASMRFWQNTVK
jgi:hypothetical protein